MSSFNTFICLLITCACFAPGQIHGQECFPAEVVLVLDDSESIRIFNPVTDSFTFAVDYSAVVRDLLADFDSNTVQVSLVTYSETAVELVSLTSNYQRIFDEVDTYTKEYSSQRTDVAIDTAINAFGSPKPGVYRYMILFMDGTSSNPDQTRQAVIRAGENNITIISISMRGPLDESLIVSGRTYRRFSVNSPSELASRPDIIKEVSTIVCSECKGIADVVYLLDGSNSTRRLSADFSDIVYAPGVIDFVVNITHKVALGGIRMGIAIYSNTADEVISVTANGNDIIEAVRNVTPQYLDTMAGVAFLKARTMLESATPPRPKDTRRIIVYLVDGSVTNQTDLAIQTQAIRDEGIIVYGAGFAPAASFEDLLVATGTPDNLARIASDLDLVQFVDPFVEFLCQNPPSMTSELSL